MQNCLLIQSLPSTEIVTKLAYSAPVFKVFGSVNVLTLGAAGTSCDGVNTGSNNQKSSAGNCVSDPSAKENVLRVGTHALGFGLYLFDYKSEFCDAWGFGRQFGVMADEVEAVMPAAVCVHPDGYKMVNYSMLGITRTVH